MRHLASIRPCMRKPRRHHAARSSRDAAPHAFCGFYVAKADAKLFNKASKVVVARKGERTAVTMASDYQGDLKEFALVVPVPTVDHEGADQDRRERDRRSSRRLQRPAPGRVLRSRPLSTVQRRSRPDAERRSPRMPRPRRARLREAPSPKPSASRSRPSTRSANTTSPILSAKQSDGLATYLNQEGYKIPDGAAPVLGSYIKQDMKFFVARVNLKEQAKSARSICARSRSPTRRRSSCCRSASAP